MKLIKKWTATSETKYNSQEDIRLKENYELEAPGPGLPHISAEYLEMSKT